MKSYCSHAGQIGRITPRAVGFVPVLAAIAVFFVMSASQIGGPTLEGALAAQAAPSAAEQLAYFPAGFPTIDAEIEPHIESF